MLSACGFFGGFPARGTIVGKPRERGKRNTRTSNTTRVFKKNSQSNRKCNQGPRRQQRLVALLVRFQFLISKGVRFPAYLQEVGGGKICPVGRHGELDHDATGVSHLVFTEPGPCPGCSQTPNEGEDCVGRHESHLRFLHNFFLKCPPVESFCFIGILSQY